MRLSTEKREEGYYGYYDNQPSIKTSKQHAFALP